VPTRVLVSEDGVILEVSGSLDYDLQGTLERVLAERSTKQAP
jgi:hypothetical protein